jgi:hypothetical protein
MVGARAPWARLLILCGVLALHNAMRIGPVTFIEELRDRYGVDYAGAGNVVGAYALAYGALLDRGLGFGAVWGLATGLGALRVLAVLGIREPARTTQGPS